MGTGVKETAVKETEVKETEVKETEVKETADKETADKETEVITPIKRVSRPLSPFQPTVKMTLSLHREVSREIDGFDGNSADLTNIMSNALGDSFAIRAVSRSRKTAKGFSSGPVSLMVYVAPKGYEFPSTVEHGVRLDAETANLLRDVARKMGLDPNDSASIIAVAKALAQKVKSV